MSWEKEDKKVWKSSTVMREFEKQIIAIMSKINELKKESLDSQTVNSIMNSGGSSDDKAKAIGAAVEASNPAEDPLLSDEVEKGNDDAMEKEASKIISDLNIILKKAKANSDMVAVYNIERAIQEIKDR